MLTVNGKITPSPASQLLADFLTAAGFDPARVVVELNDKIVLREQYQEVMLSDGDILEIITFVGGG